MGCEYPCGGKLVASWAALKETKTIEAKAIPAIAILDFMVIPQTKKSYRHASPEFRYSPSGLSPSFWGKNQ
ncbi:MAG: hypothetical protein ACYTG0_05420 [Planctomycetota bacterium]|jgi:hypothetical protein